MKRRAFIAGLAAPRCGPPMKLSKLRELRSESLWGRSQKTSASVRALAVKNSSRGWSHRLEIKGAKYVQQ